MNRCRSLLRLLLPVALALTLGATALVVNGQPPIPMLPWGVVYVNGEPAEDGTLVEAKIGGEVVASGYTYTEDGEQGHYVLSIEGQVGDIVHFFVLLGIEADESPRSWRGGIYHLDLHIGRPYLVAEINAPETAAVGTTFDVFATVSNTGTLEGHATGVTLTLNVTGGASLLGDAERAIGDLDAGATSDPVTWTLHCNSPEPAVVVVRPAGIEVNTGSAMPEDNLVPDEAEVLQRSVMSIDIAPDDVTIKAEYTQVYTVTAYDSEDNSWDVTAEAVFSTTDECGYFTDNVYYACRVGEWEQTAGWGGFSDSTGVTVVHGDPEQIEIEPATATVIAGESVTYTVTAYDSEENDWDVTAEALFTITTGAGGSWTDNVYTSEKAGDWTVTGSYDSLSDTATLTVNPSAEVKSLEIGPIADQVVNDPFTIVITAYNGHGNVADYDGTGVLTDTTDTITPTTVTFVDGVATATVTITTWQDDVTITATVGLIADTSNTFDVKPLQIFMPIIFKTTP